MATRLIPVDPHRKCDRELAAFYTGLRRKGRVHDQAAEGLAKPGRLAIEMFRNV